MEMYPNQDIPSGDSLWAEQANWACHALNCTATTANPGNKTPHKMWHGSPPENNLLPFLKPGFCRVRRTDKLQRKAQRCWYLGPAPGYPRDAVRVMTESGRTIATRHVTWAYVPPTPPPVTQQAIPAPNGARDDQVEGGPAGSESAEQPPAARFTRFTSGIVPAA